MFSNQLKRLRESKGLSQKALAEILYVSQQTVGKWENEKATPNPEMLVKIAKYFNVSTDYILGREDFGEISKDPSDETIKFALFGGDVTDAAWEDVKDFVQYIRQKHNLQGKGKGDGTE